MKNKPFNRFFVFDWYMCVFKFQNAEFIKYNRPCKKYSTRV